MDLYTLIQNATPLGVILVLGLVILQMVGGTDWLSKKIGRKSVQMTTLNGVEQIRDNHLHEVREMLREQAEYQLEEMRLLNEMNKTLAIISTKLDHK